MTSEKLPNGTVLLQDDRFLKLSVDAILLAAACPPARRACDLGCGVGGVLMSLADRQPGCELVGLEINPDAAALCRRSAELNGLCGRVRVVDGDLRELPPSLRMHGFDLVACNPPYLRASSVRPPSDPARQLEMLDATAAPADVARAAAALLCPDGVFLCVLRPDRLEDYRLSLAEQGLAVRALRYVSHHAGADPVLVLLAADFSDTGVCQVLPTLPLTEDGETSPDYQAILEGKPCQLCTL